jgi:mRNA-degrading endonuclease RelE of RelBE toxin-antitoxin system
MKHFASPAFWQHYRKLPTNIRERADKNFKLLKQDSSHPSLHLKKVSRFWSVRVGKKYRALAVQVEEGLIWFWIGPHTEYDKLVGS